MSAIPATSSVDTIKLYTLPSKEVILNKLNALNLNLGPYENLAKHLANATAVTELFIAAECQERLDKVKEIDKFEFVSSLNLAKAIMSVATKIETLALLKVDFIQVAPIDLSYEDLPKKAEDKKE